MRNISAIEYKRSEHMDFSDLKGKRVGGFKKVQHCGNDTLLFADYDGGLYLMTHDQDCCENVYIEDICGSWDDIEWQEILEAYENVEGYTPTYTFYTFKTFQGSVTVRWCGESNGYYSERVDLYKIFF